MVNLDMPYTTPFMLGTLTNKEKIKESTYLTGTEAVDLLIDVETLLQESKLTAKQQEVVELYYFNQMTQEEVAEKLGITQQGVLDHLKKIKVRVAKVIERWKKLDERLQ